LFVIAMLPCLIKTIVSERVAPSLPEIDAGAVALLRLPMESVPLHGDDGR